MDKIEPRETGFEITTSEAASYTARALILATGMTRKRLGVPGEEKFLRKGIFYSSLPDFSFVEGKDAAVIAAATRPCRSWRTCRR